MGGRDGSGPAASGAAGWLGLAAAPTFAFMTLWTGLSGGQPDMLCVSVQGSSPMSGMTLMYALMSAFHAAPWLKLIASRRRDRNGLQRAFRKAKSQPSSAPRISCA
jgi:hypothetical protein